MPARSHADSGPNSSSPGRRKRRDRHGRGLRGRLAPLSVPMARTRAETFDVMVVQAIEHLGPQVGERLSGVEFAVVDVPDPIEASETSDEVLEDGPVALSRIHRAGLEGMSGPVIVFYRRPIETRATRPEELSGLVHDVVVEQIARYLGETPEEIDPPAH